MVTTYKGALPAAAKAAANGVADLDSTGKVLSRALPIISGSIYSKRIATDTDNAYVFVPDSAIVTTGLLLVGDNGGVCDIGFRFTDVNIPKNAVIVSAYLTLVTGDDCFNVVNKVKYQAEAADNPLTFSDYADFIARPVGTAMVNQTVPGSVNGTVYNTPELKTLIQEVINRAGWLVGNSLVVFMKDDGSSGNALRMLRDYFEFPTEAAILHIEWISEISSHNGLPLRDVYPAHPRPAVAILTTTVNTTPIVLLSSYDVVLVDTTIGDITLNLPSAASYAGRSFTIIKKTIDAYTVIITPDGAETVNGGPNKTLTSQWEAARVVSNGVEWFVI